jgi:hypothetical protein
MQNSSKHKTQLKIRYLEDQLVSLDHYLPETYDCLMRELDQQKYTLVELEIREKLSQIEGGNQRAI